MRKQQVIALALAAASTASLVTGCGGKKEEAPAGNGQPAATQAAGAETEKLEGSLVCAEPKEFTIFLNFNNMPFDSTWQVWQENQCQLKRNHFQDKLQRGGGI